MLVILVSSAMRAVDRQSEPGMGSNAIVPGYHSALQACHRKPERDMLIVDQNWQRANLQSAVQGWLETKLVLDVKLAGDKRLA